MAQITIKKIKQEFIDHISTFFLVFIAFIFSLLRIPSLIEPYWYGDEGIYEVIGMALNKGRLLYEGIWDNKPPVLYVIYALFNGDQFSVRLASLVCGVGTVIAFYYLSKRLFKANRSQYLSTSIFAVLFGLPFLEGNIANAENFMLLPIILSFYFLLSPDRKRSGVHSVIAGVLISIAFLTKIVAIFDFAALLVSIFIIRYFDVPLIKKRGNILKRIDLNKAIGLLREEAVFIASFVIPILVVALFFVVNGTFSYFYKAAFSQNIGYVGYHNYFLIPQGLLILKLIFLVVGLLLVIRVRNILGVTGSVIYIWLIFSLFNAFFSARPYTHYVLVVLPAFCLLPGYLIDKKEHLTSFLKGRLFILNLLTVFLVIFLITRFFSTYNKTLPYYKNYLDFVFNEKSVTDYQAFFDKNTPRDYEIARYIKMNTMENDTVFLWSDSGQIYALIDKLPLGRYIVAYHVTFYKDAVDEMKQLINSEKPKYIVDTKHTAELNQFLPGYILQYKIAGAKIYERL